MIDAKETLHKLEMDACLVCGEVHYVIGFDGNAKPLRVILSHDYLDKPIFIYRRGGIDLTFDQAADLIRCNDRAHKEYGE